MSLEKGDRSLQEMLDWAVGRLAKGGYKIRSQVSIVVDPKLSFMGYASERDGVQQIVISEWAVRSEMLGGLLFHELAHVYHTERRSPSHRPHAINEAITEFSRREGLSTREVGYLAECFSHLQNVIADDIVFEVMNEDERRQAQRFFLGWVVEKASGSPIPDSAALARNAFAIASLKRHDLLGDDSTEAVSMNARLLASLGRSTRDKSAAMEEFLEKADPGWDEEEFGEKLAFYLDLLVGLLREKEQLEDLR